MIRPTITNTLSVKIRRSIIALLAGLLIIYHLNLMVETYFSGGTTVSSPMMHVQSFIRVMIVCSLVLVATGKRLAIWGMWFSITALVVTQYLVHFGPQPPEFLASRSGLSYLRGFIIPTLITVAFPLSNRNPGSSQAETNMLTVDKRNGDRR
ncbi:hypothetical protein GCM10017044_15350 [Kordiimonas sediminis]|uniref:Uncharacterized protein n=1 Tax=Kordiimonas sediminis TaxID=1735581 RepID=A0A919AQK3_9PROT|nr:hypothetical protein [Kordiimonas sediminis]GHF22166.1 hypothetical protein GCM10017044_15350 [Kordiimonas sediminis]